MDIMCFKVGYLSTNCYVLSCKETKKAVIIDPGLETENEANEILDFIKENKLQIKYIINTHGHPDHINGNEIIKKATGALVLIHKENKSYATADQKLVDRDIICVGNFNLVVLHTPGHSPDGICLLGDNFIFTGDTLFAGSIGRTDFAGGSFKDIMHSIKTKLLPLPDNIIVYPGHECFTTIGEEKKHNPFLLT